MLQQNDVSFRKSESILLKPIKEKPLSILPEEIRDMIAIYSYDFLIAVALNCSTTVLRELSGNYIQKYNVYEYLKYSEVSEIWALYLIQCQYDALNPLILALLMQFHETCHTIKSHVPAFPYANNLHCLQMLYQNGYEVEYATFVIAAKHGSVECLNFLQNHFTTKQMMCPNAPSLLDFAIMGNNMDNVKYLLGKYPFSDKSIGHAAKNGNFELVQLLHDSGAPLSAFSIEKSFEYGNIFQTKYLRQLGCPVDANVFNLAVKKGVLCIARCLHSKGCPINEDVMEHAVYGNVDVVTWLLSLDFGFTRDTFKIAASTGNLEMMQFLYDNDCPFSKGTFRAAVEQGNLDILKFLHSVNCPVDTYTFASAVVHNDLNLLDYLHGKCPLNSYTFEKAAGYSEIKILKWLASKNCPFNWESLEESSELNEHVGVYLYVQQMPRVCNK